MELYGHPRFTPLEKILRLTVVESVRRSTMTRLDQIYQAQIGKRGGEERDRLIGEIIIKKPFMSSFLK